MNELISHEVYYGYYFTKINIPCQFCDILYRCFTTEACIHQDGGRNVLAAAFMHTCMDLVRSNSQYYKYNGTLKRSADADGNFDD